MFRNIIPRSQTENLNDEGIISYRGHHYYRQRDLFGRQFLKDVNAVHIRQAIVQQQHIVLSFFQARKAFPSGVNDLEFDVESVQLEMRFGQVGVGRIIFRVENAKPLVHAPLRLFCPNGCSLVSSQ